MLSPGLALILTDVRVSHDVPEHGNLLPGRVEHLHRRLGGAVRRQVDNLGRKLPARLLLDASSHRRADSSGKRSRRRRRR